MVGITPLPTPPSTSDPANFDTRADTFLGALPTFVTEANAYAQWLAAAAQPAACYIADLWVSGTSGDPGSGCVGGNNATQNASTALRIDDLDALGITVSAIVDTFDDSTSALKGFLRIQKVGDPSKWLLWRVNGAVVNSTGYRTVSVAVVAGTGSNPFTAGDAVVITFVPAGDKGDTGPPAQWVDVLSPASLNGLSQLTLSSIPTTYADFRIMFLNNSGGSPDISLAVSPDGSTFSSAQTVFSAVASTRVVELIIQDYRSDRPRFTASTPDGLGSSPDVKSSTTIAAGAILCTGGISAIRVTPSAGWTSGAQLYQPRAR